MQLIGLGILALVAWYFWRVLKREMARVDRKVDAARKPDETLVRDPETGRYRIGKRD